MKTDWDSYWEKESNRSNWLEPSKAVVELTSRLDRTKVRDVLDIGCGTGRHALYLAKAGFDVTGVDSSPEALRIFRRQVTESEASIRIIEGDYNQDLFTAASFDLVLAINILYHGYRETFKEAIKLIHRWLRSDGRLLFTCPTRKDDKCGSNEQVASHTYRPLNSVHPGDIHYFADEADIYDFLSGFGDISITVDEHYWDNEGARQFSSYWQIEAVK